MAESFSASILRKNHYDILSVGVNSSTDEIKRSFRSLARQFHPDKCSDPFAGEIFRRISSAYQVLTDKAKREVYDEKMTDAGEIVGDME